MGCICSKGVLTNQYVAENHGRDKELNSNKHLKKRLEGRAGVDNGGNDATARLISNPRPEENAGFAPVLSDEVGRRAVVTTGNPTKPQLQKHSSMEVGTSGVQLQPREARLTSVTNGARGAQVVAGWPSWLTAVAGEAISGWVPRRAESFEKLEKVFV